MNNVKCDCCGTLGLEKLADYKEYQHSNCKKCGFESFTRLNPTISSDLYENDADYVDDLNVVTSPEDLILWHHTEALNFIKKKFPKRNEKTLDIGCFNGFFVKKLYSLGYDAEGIDFNRNAIEFGKSKFDLGLRISSQSLGELLLSGRKFDVITLFEVIEHLPNARQFLCEVTKLLARKGVLILSTPNNNMCWRPMLDFPPHHLSRFTIKSLEGYVSQLGLKTFYTAEQMSIFEIFRHYVGSFFRSKENASLRGGKFKNKKITIFLHRVLNRTRGFTSILLAPIDKTLYFMGLRYISQIIVAGKN
jgi:2-polyprenyl-3-methyl-5-hydroxy-6-metoxy-1,4-benzoquinol methylase